MDAREIANTLATMELARRATLGLLEDIPEDKLFYQPLPNANHALWNIGHLACSDSYFLTKLAGIETGFPAEWNDLFGMGSTPHADAERYPSATEIKAQLAKQREALISWFKAMDDEQLGAPLPDDFQMFAPNYGAMLQTIAWHEGLHAGQLTVIRKALGLKPVFA